MDVAVVLEFHLDESRAHSESRRLHASDAPQSKRRHLSTAQRRDRCRLRRETEFASSPIGERLHAPAFNPAGGLGRVRDCVPMREEAGPSEWDDYQPDDNRCENLSQVLVGDRLVAVPPVPLDVPAVTRRAVAVVLPAVHAVSGTVCPAVVPATSVEPAR